MYAEEFFGGRPRRRIVGAPFQYSNSVEFNETFRITREGVTRVKTAEIFEGAGGFQETFATAKPLETLVLPARSVSIV